MITFKDFIQKRRQSKYGLVQDALRQFGLDIEIRSQYQLENRYRIITISTKGCLTCFAGLMAFSFVNNLPLEGYYMAFPTIISAGVVNLNSARLSYKWYQEDLMSGKFKDRNFNAR